VDMMVGVFLALMTVIQAPAVSSLSAG